MEDLRPVRLPNQMKNNLLLLKLSQSILLDHLQCHYVHDDLFLNDIKDELDLERKMVNNCLCDISPKIKSRHSLRGS